VLSLNPARPGSALRAVPVLGQQLLAGEVFRGEALPIGPVAAASASTLLVALLAFGALVRVLRHEEALVRG
jgi:sodium transport system permease protein